MDSVAGRIRVDVLASAANFKAGMREAGREGLGSFQGEYQKTVRATSKKQLAENINKEAAAWKTAMKELRGEVKETGQVMIQWYQLENRMRTYSPASERNRLRRADMMPTGFSRSVTLSSAQAEEAAALGAAERRGMTFGEGARRAGGLGGLAARELFGREGAREFREASELTEGMSIATKGAGLFAAALVVARHEAAELGKEIKETREEANKLGLTYDQYANQKGLPQYSRFTEGGALAATAGSSGLKGLAAWGFGQLVKRPEIALGPIGYLMGGADPEALANLARQEEDQRLRRQRENAEIQRNWERREAARRGLEGLEGELSMMKNGAEAGRREEWIKKLAPDQDQIARWDELTQKVRAAKGELAVFHTRNELKSNLLEALTPGHQAQEEYRQNLRMEGLRPWEVDQRLAERRSTLEDTERIGRAQHVAGGLATSTPEGRLSQALADADAWRKHEAEMNQSRQQSESQYWAMRKEALQNYYREAFQLEEKELHQRLRTASEVYRDQLAHLQQAETAGIITPATAGRARAEEERELRRGLGLNTGEDDYRRGMTGLAQAWQKERVTREEFERRERELRQSSVSGMTSGLPESHPMGMLEAGSAAAHSMIAQGANGDPKLAAALEANSKLDKIWAALCQLVDQGEDPGDILGQ